MSKVDIRLIDEEEIEPQTFVKIPKKKKFDDGTIPQRKDPKRMKKTKRVIEKEPIDKE
jgi:hypothetical protein